MHKKIVIVGGVAGGASAAARLRRLDEELEIVMFERDAYISFANCGLPYYIGDAIKERSRLLVQTPETMKDRFNIDVRINSEVVGLDPVNKTVTVHSEENGTYEETYDYLVLSPGAKALRPNIDGINSHKIFTLRNIPDIDRIKAYVEREETTSAVVIGGGYIGVEMAENLKERGIRVTLVEEAPQILNTFDPDMAVRIEKELEENGIALKLSDGVEAFKEVDGQVNVILRSGTSLVADMVVLSIGIVPDTVFLKNTGLELGQKGHIVVNERMQTNLEEVYAVGDAVEVTNYITGQKTAIPLAGPANKQGRIAADNICGLPFKYKGTQGTAILKVFGLTAASTGENEKGLERANVPYKVVQLHPVSHASYYPGALPMALKLIFDEEGKILGAQAIGYDGVDKRIDVIAAAIRYNGTVDDLTELELSYAPPYSSAKDPVNMAGYIAQNLLAGRSHLISWQDIGHLPNQEYTLLDVRTEEEFNNGHLEGALNIPVDQLRNRLKELKQEIPVIVYCQVGLRGYIADRLLSQHGLTVYNVSGGYKSASVLDFIPKSLDLFDQDKSNRVTVEQDTQVVKKDDDPDKSYDKALDACGLSCPGPLMQVKAGIDELNNGQILKVTASDPGFYEDIKAWCKRTNNELLNINKDGANITVHIKKRANDEFINPNVPGNQMNLPAKDNKTLIVFSGDLDKALAAFIIANGAAAMGKKVTMFFTFWGLNILRKPDGTNVKKGLIDSMFGKMMPKGAGKLKLSKMNMMGIGTSMMRKVMRDKKISSLDELVEAAVNSGIEIVACQMSMDVMGIQKEELMDGVKIGGVGYMLGESEDSNMNLFI